MVLTLQSGRLKTARLKLDGLIWMLYFLFYIQIVFLSIMVSFDDLKLKFECTVIKFLKLSVMSLSDEFLKLRKKHYVTDLEQARLLRMFRC